jgi:hypothetical protein
LGHGNRKKVSRLYKNGKQHHSSLILTNNIDKIFADHTEGKQPYKKLLFDLKLPKQIADPTLYGRSVLSADGTIQEYPNPYLQMRQERQ